MRTASSGAGGPISDRLQQKILFQMDQGRLASIISITSNVGHNPNGWIVPRGCFRRDVFYVHNEGENASDYDCLRINHMVMTNARATASPLWQAVYERLGAPLPPQLILSEFDYLRRNRGAFVSVALYVNPEAKGITTPGSAWLDSPWHKIHLDAAHKAYLDDVVRWAENYRANVQAAWD